MNQKTDETTKGDLVPQEKNTELQTQTGSNMMPPEEFKKLLIAEGGRRDALREYITGNFKSGVHYCMTGKRWVDGKYKPVYYMDGEEQQSDDKTGKMELLQPGAQTACDVMRCRFEFHPDNELIAALGKDAEGWIILIVKIISRDTGDIVGEGRGACSLKEKYGSMNSAIKQCQIRCLRNGVINTFALSDLYEQDVDDATNQQNEEAAKRDPKQIYVEEKVLAMGLDEEGAKMIYSIFEGNGIQMYNVFKFMDDIEDKKIIEKIKKLTPIQAITTAKNSRCDMAQFKVGLEDVGGE